MPDLVPPSRQFRDVRRPANARRRAPRSPSDGRRGTLPKPHSAPGSTLPCRGPGHRAARYDETLRRCGGARWRRSLRIEAGRVLLPARTVRLRQDDDPQPDRRVHPADVRRAPDRGPARQRPAAAPAQRQHGLPELRAVPAHDGRRERRVRAADGAACRRRGRSARRRVPRARRSRRLSATDTRGNCPAARPSAWHSPVRSPSDRPSCCSTSRSGRSTSSSASRCRSSSRASTARSARPSCSSPTTRRRRCRWRRGSRSWPVGSVRQIGPPREIYQRTRRSVRRRLHRRDRTSSTVDRRDRTARPRLPAAQRDGRRGAGERRSRRRRPRRPDGPARIGRALPGATASAPSRRHGARATNVAFMGNHTRITVQTDAGILVALRSMAIGRASSRGGDVGSRGARLVGSARVDGRRRPATTTPDIWRRSVE